MCERSLCRPGYVGSLLNLPPAADSFYFPNLRANGSHQLAASLPALAYPRSPIAWTPPPPPPSPAGHAFGAAAAASSSQPPPYLALHKEAPEGPPKYYAPEGASKPERSRPSREGAPREPRGIPTKYQPRGLAGPAAARLEADPGAAGLKEDLERALNLNVTLLPAAAQLGLRGAQHDGPPWCPTPQGRPRKKRKPYTKPQIAQLESEFVLHEFINRQKRKELAQRLHLSDQQVKIWFQNRRMKKKRAAMREQALALD